MRKISDRIGQILTSSDQQVTNSAIAVYLVRVINAGIVFCLHVLIARLLGASAFGIFAFVWILTTIAGQLSAVGFNESVKRFLPSYLITEDQSRAAGFLLVSQLVPMVVSIVVALVISLFVLTIRDHIPESYVIPILIGLATIPIITITHVQECIALSRSLSLRGLVPGYIIRPVLIGVFVLVGLFYLEYEADAVIAAIALAIASICALVLQTPLVNRPIWREIGNKPIEWDTWLWIKASLPLLLVQSFYVLAINLDILIIGMFLSASDVGIYFAVAKTAGLIAFMHQAVSQAGARRLSEIHASGDEDAFLGQFHRATRWAFWPTLISSLGLMLLSPLFFPIFGPEFVAGVPIVPILLFGIIVQAATGPLQDVLVIRGQQTILARIAACGLAMNVGLNLILIPGFGLTGAAIASSVALSGRILLLWLTFRGKIGQAVE